MTLLRIDPAGDVAPYEQVRTQVAAMVAEGELAAGQKLPTVRQLAATARALGLSMAETTRLVERAWSQPTR